MAMKIRTVFGVKTVVRRIGEAGQYVWTAPLPNAPNGEWWTFNPQKGWVPIPSNGRALMAARAAAGV